MRKTLILTALTLIAASAFAAGEVYRWKDSDGTWHYSDQPHPGAELVRSGGNQRPATIPTDALPPPAPPPAPETGTVEDAPPVSEEVANQVRAEAATAKTQQCKKAEERYNTAISARRIYKTDAEGNRVYLTDTELDAQRLQARAARDLACG
jgi:hypothetical protein